MLERGRSTSLLASAQYRRPAMKHTMSWTQPRGLIADEPNFNPCHVGQNPLIIFPCKWHGAATPSHSDTNDLLPIVISLFYAMEALEGSPCGPYRDHFEERRAIILVNAA